MSAMMLTQIRMVIGGIVILGISIILKHDIFAMFKDWRMIINLVLYAILGMIPDQLFYFMTVDYGDASITTILQYLGPFFIMLYMALFHHQIPSRLEIISAIVAFFWCNDNCDGWKIYLNGNYSKSIILGNIICNWSNAEYNFTSPFAKEI